MRQQHFATGGCFERQRGNRIDQGVDACTAAAGDRGLHGRCGIRRSRQHAERRLDAIGSGRGGRFGQGPPRPGAPRAPQAVPGQSRKQHDGKQDQRRREAHGRDLVQGEQARRDAVIQAASASVTAVSMSTATMRDTPCSCIVTPIS